MAAPVVDEHGEVCPACATAALVLGVQYLGRLALAERIPARRDVRRRGHPWRFRRRDIEQVAAARALIALRMAGERIRE